MLDLNKATPRNPTVRREHIEMNKQFGGTVLGLLIGAGVGLAVALLVAVYVSKVPVPFTDARTAAVNGAERDASEAKKNKDWDPNGALSSKGRVPPPPAAETPNLGGVRNPVALPPLEAPAVVGNSSLSRNSTSSSGGTSNGNTMDNSTLGNSRPAVVAKADPRAGMGDPLGDLARSRIGSTASNSGGGTSNSGASASTDPFAYFVQAGAFRGPGEADAQRAKLAIMGMEAQVSEREQAGRVMYRVRIGPFGRKDDADRTKEKLDDAGLQTALVRVNK